MRQQLRPVDELQQPRGRLAGPPRALLPALDRLAGNVEQAREAWLAESQARANRSDLLRTVGRRRIGNGNLRDPQLPLAARVVDSLHQTGLEALKQARSRVRHSSSSLSSL